MHIREAQTELYIMDIHSMFYESRPLIYDGKIWGVGPNSTHLRIVPDFPTGEACSSWLVTKQIMQ
jgi:hypothetical protein